MRTGSHFSACSITNITWGHWLLHVLDFEKWRHKWKKLKPEKYML
jgi:hypothetical protein